MKNILLYTLFIAGAIVLLSNNSGRGRIGGPATTSPGESGIYCGTVGCHSSNAFQPELEILLIDGDGEHVTEYLPGEEYTVSVKINHIGFPAGYGFQIVSLKDEDNTGVNNWINIPQPLHDVNLMGRQYLEQDSRLPVDSIPMTWMAPEEGTGSVTFYAAGNAVNGNGNSGGDGADTSFLKVMEAEVSSIDDLIQSEILVYPNPAIDHIYVKGDNIDYINLYNSQGRLIKTNFEQSVSLDKIPSGIIYVEVGSDQKKTIKKLIKI